MANRTMLTLLAAGLVSLAPAMALGADGAFVAATDPAAAGDWGVKIDGMVGAGQLRVAQDDPDPDLPGFRFLRYRQLIRGVPVMGQVVIRHVDPKGNTRTVFADLADDTGLDARPRIGAERAVEVAKADLGDGARAIGQAELAFAVVDGRLRLTYTLWCGAPNPLRVKRYFVDAHSGEVARTLEGIYSAGVIGTGFGAWGDKKKLSVSQSGATYMATDVLRPGRSTTHDASRVDFENSLIFFPSQYSNYIATDADNSWTNTSVVDAHAGLGWIYDYYYRVHSWQGFDGRNGEAQVFVDAFDYPNAFYNSAFKVLAFASAGSDYKAFTSGLDIVAHEFTHGVTAHTWNGEYIFQSGALNEAFSDIMGASIERAFQQSGSGHNQADWLMGEDVFTCTPFSFCRSMSNPGAFYQWSTYYQAYIQYPDHASQYWSLPASDDNGGVHTNGSIVTHAFYLLVQGGRNRTSGIQVTGLGVANREEAEKIFFRGFTRYLGPHATFYDAVLATYQAAVDLYGENSNEVNQVYQAWRAVGMLQ